MKLFYAPGACSLSSHIVANEAEVLIDLEKVYLRDHRTQSGEDYYTINRKGYVPALQLDDGGVLTEGPAIVQYLADLKPESGLLAGVGKIERYQVVEWLTYISSEIHKSFSPLFGDASNEEKGSATGKIKRRFAFVENSIENKLFLTGDRFTVADAYMFVMLRWADKMRIELTPNLRELHDRIAARPKVKKSLEEESLVSSS